MIGKNSPLPLLLRLFIMALLFALLISAGSARAADITLIPGQNPDPELSSCEVYSGKAIRNDSGSYARSASATRGVSISTAGKSIWPGSGSAMYAIIPEERAFSLVTFFEKESFRG
jgi:hypothetical protein